MEPYKLSPTSGTIQDEKIVGRQEEIDHLNQILLIQSVVLKQFRRMGKTLLVKKLAYQSTDKNKAVYFMLQGVNSPNQLTDILLQELRDDQKFGKLRIGWDKVKKMLTMLKPEVEFKDVSIKLPEFQSHWKEILSNCIEDIAERKRNENETLTLILDEFPIMLWDWMENGNVRDVIDLLNLFRKIRQDYEAKGKLRFLFCGSIGVEIVLDRLKREHRYVGEAFNETYKYAMEAMSKEDSLFLCKCLYLDDFKSIKSDTADLEHFFVMIMDNANHLPVYIHAQFSILRLRFGSVLSEENITQAYEIMLTNKDQNYSEMFNQLWERIRIYYKEEQAKLMRTILSYLAKKRKYISEEEIIRSIEGDPEVLKENLALLERDHYLTCKGHPKRTYQFKYELIKKWWEYNKA